MAIIYLRQLSVRKNAKERWSNRRSIHADNNIHYTLRAMEKRLWFHYHSIEIIISDATERTESGKLVGHQIRFPWMHVACLLEYREIRALVITHSCQVPFEWHWIFFTCVSAVGVYYDSGSKKTPWLGPQNSIAGTFWNNSICGVVEPSAIKE